MEVAEAKPKFSTGQQVWLEWITIDIEIGRIRKVTNGTFEYTIITSWRKEDGSLDPFMFKSVEREPYEHYREINENKQVTAEWYAEDEISDKPFKK